MCLDFIVVIVGICNIGCVSFSIVRNNIPLTVPRAISPPFSAPQHHYCCYRCRKHCSGKQPGSQVWGCSSGLCDSGPGQGSWETEDFNKYTGHLQIWRVCSSIHGSSRFLEKREGGWEAFWRCGVEGGESQDCAVSPVWFGPSTEPAGLIRT